MNPATAQIIATAVAFPQYHYPQSELSGQLRQVWKKRGLHTDVFDRITENLLVESRYLSRPKEFYLNVPGFAARNQIWKEEALPLGKSCIQDLLRQSELQAGDVQQIVTSTVTGIAVPSLDALLMNQLPFSSQLKRVPMFGLGCLAGTAGVARVADYLKGHPQDAAILLSVELCSLTFQLHDLSIANVIASQLFGDGAAAVLMVGQAHPLADSKYPRIIDSRSIFFPHTEEVMGWKISDRGFEIVLNSGVPEFAEKHIKPAMDQFLGQQDLNISDITHWIAHPGGPKVLQAMEQGLGLDSHDLKISWESLKKVGNLSSSSVLMILNEFMAHNQPQAGSYGLMISFGPGFCAELVLLKW